MNEDSDFKTFVLCRLEALQNRVKMLEVCNSIDVPYPGPFKGDETVRVTFSRAEAEALWAYLKDKTYFPARVSDPRVYSPTTKIGQALGVIP